MGYIDFTFNGISARDMRVKSVRVDEGIMTIPFVGDGEIAASKPSGRIGHSVHRVNRDNLIIPMQLLLVGDDGNPTIWTDKEIYRIADWLLTDTFKPLVLGDNTGIQFYAVLASSEGLSHYAEGGILPIEMQTNSPYGWSIPSYETFEIEAGVSTLELVGKHNAEKYYRPMFEIQSYTEGSEITFTNKTLQDKPVELNNFYLNEKIIIDNDYELIMTEKENRIIGDRFNWEWMKLRRGTNEIEVNATGKFTLVVRNEYPIVALGVSR